MRISNFLMATVATVAVASSAQAAGLVIGSYDSGNCYPYLCQDSGTSSGQIFDYQQIYNGSLFSGATTISSITYYGWTPIPGTNVLNGNYAITFGTTTSALGSGYPVSLSNTATFYTGNLGGAIGSTFTINGAPYAYDPSNGNLVIEIVASNLDNVPNSGLGYFWADYTGTQTTRAYYLTNVGVASGTGALVTGFNVGGVPEASTWAMLIAGFGMVGAAARRRKVTTVAA
jgi:hypothetical protein